jgi:hypothetical protein
VSRTGFRRVSEAPDYISPFVGWRLWLVARDRSGRLRLTSVMRATVWPVREPMVAECVRRRTFLRSRSTGHARKRAPVASCRCGIYAIGNPRLLGPFIDTNHVRRCGPQWVVGSVAMWGTVIESERGWRASHAYPRQLYVPLARRNRSAAAEIERDLKQYGVEVSVFDSPISTALLNKLSVIEPVAA